MIVLKIGGQQLDDSGFLRGLAQVIAGYKGPLVIVHGGGRATTELSKKLGLESRFVQGLRVTDSATLEAAVMGLVGTASATLVSALVAEEVAALGLSGLDAHLVIVEPKTEPPGLEWVGHPVEVNAPRIQALVQAGFVPCIAPICISRKGTQLYNVNADPVAAAVAAGTQARTLVFVTNVRAVLKDGQPLSHLTPEQTEELIAQEVIVGGMIPKVRAALEVLAMGVASALITDLEGLRHWLVGETAGTLFTADSFESAPRLR